MGLFDTFTGGGSSPFSGSAGRNTAIFAANLAQQQGAGAAADINAGMTGALGAYGGAYGTATGALQGGVDTARGALTNAYNTGAGAIGTGYGQAINAANAGYGGASQWLGTGYSNARNDLTAGANQAGDIYGAGGQAASGYIGTGQGQQLGAVNQGYGQGLGTLGGISATFNPYSQSGAQAQTTLAGALGLGGPGAQALARQAYTASPGYQYAVDQAMDQVNRGAAATGGIGSGNQLTALQNRAHDLANQDYGTWVNNLTNMGNLGYQATGQQAGAQTNLAGAQIGQGTAQANIYGTTAAQQAAIAQQTAAQRGQVAYNTAQTLSGQDVGQGVAQAANAANLGTTLAGYGIGQGQQLADLARMYGTGTANLATSLGTGLSGLAEGYGGQQAGALTSGYNSLANEINLQTGQQLPQVTAGGLAGQQAQATGLNFGLGALGTVASIAGAPFTGGASLFGLGSSLGNLFGSGTPGGGGSNLYGSGGGGIAGDPESQHMPVYDFSSGLGLLKSGFGSLADSLKTTNQQQQSVALANALSSGDWDGAMQAAAAAGDTNTVLKLRELKQSGDQAAAFNTQIPEAIKALYPGGLGGTGTPATSGTAGTPLAATGGSAADQVSKAILGQESGGNPNVGDSPDGAKGIGQIMPATFAQYAKPGEVITNPTDNYNVHQRIIQDYAQRYNNDPRRIAVAYFSGPGNVAGPESPTPWIRNRRDEGGKGTSVSSYVNGVLSRMGGGSPTGTPSALLGGGAGETQPVVRAADGTTYSGPNAAAAAAADVPSPGAAPASGTYPQLVANAPLPPSRPADLGLTADPAVAQFLISHVGPQNAARLLQAPPETPVSTLVQPGDVPPSDMVKTAGQFVSEAKQALAGGMAHGTSAGLGSTLDAPRIAAPANVPPLSSVAPVAGYGDAAPRAPAPALPVRPQPSSILPPAPMDATGGAPQTPGPPAAMAATGGAPPPVPATPRPTPIYPYGSATPAVGLPPPSAPVAAPAAPIAAGTSPDIAAIERTMPAVQQQAASVGGGQVSDAGMAAASALTSGRPVPQGLGASLAAPVINQLSPGGAPPALAGAPPQAAPVISQLAPAPDASGSTPPAGAPGATAATPPPAAAAVPAMATPANPDPPVMIGGRTWTREQADNDSSASSPSVADVAKAQGITGDIAQDESPKDIADGLKSGEYKYGGGAAPAPPIDAKLPPTPAAIKAGDPPVEAAAKVSPQVARSLAQTRPGSDQRMMLFALLMRAAANSGQQSAGNIKFVEGLMAIEKQHQEDFGKTLRTVPPAELAQLGYTPPPGALVQADPWGNLKVTPGAEPPGHILTPEEVAASPIASVTGPHRVWWQPGKPGAKPEALDAPEEDEKIVAIPPGSELAKNYPGAVATTVGGKKPGTPIYPPKALVEPEQERELAKIRVAPIKDAEAQGVTATQQRRTLAIMKDAFQYAEAHGGELPQGRLGPTIQALRSYASSVGLDNVFDLSNVAQGDVVEKMNAVLAAASAKSINQRGGTQFEFRTFLQNNPGLSQTVNGRMKLIDILDQDAARAEQMRRIATRTDTTPDNFQQRAEEYDQQHPLISPWSGKPLMTGELVPGYGAPAAARGAPVPTPGVAPGPGGYVWHSDGSLTPKVP